MHAIRTTAALLAVALLMLTPAAVALPVGPAIDIKADESSPARLCVGGGTDSAATCTPYLGQARVYGGAYAPVPERIIIGQELAWIHAGVEAEAAGHRVDTGTVGIIVGPMPVPGPGPCGVGCIPSWIVAIRDWALETACNATGVCESAARAVQAVTGRACDMAGVCNVGTPGKSALADVGLTV